MKPSIQNPTAFKSERWLEHNKRLERYLVPFSGGPRSCLGNNLARAELFSILVFVFQQFGERDIDVNHDFILAAQARDSLGILVRVRKAN
ncbi:hypothetical protein AJ78_08826 [Emergomyces pasteurianus Ep9510]|uniref:Cytochrome P450 n=1 Tax=Emergomyces pasteurianus Ep9510 TaxID=1447872 RepID=A0A1J9Q477_9EURO|nr:hypothetical protein AJ78_08826 [Emergomyces pasteurianus Ep9510]